MLNIPPSSNKCTCSWPLFQARMRARAGLAKCSTAGRQQERSGAAAVAGRGSERESFPCLSRYSVLSGRPSDGVTSCLKSVTPLLTLAPVLPKGLPGWYVI